MLANKPPEVEVVGVEVDLSPKLKVGALFFDGDSEVLEPKMLLAVLGSVAVDAVVVDPAVLAPKVKVGADVAAGVVLAPNPEKEKEGLSSVGLEKLKAEVVLVVDGVDAFVVLVELKAADPNGDAVLAAALNKLAKRKKSYTLVENQNYFRQKLY